jgi:hypothetical protein
MRSLSNVTVVLLSIFALGIGSASYLQAGSSNGDTDAILHFEIMFDGYCDGITLDIDTATGLATGVYASPCATCPFTNLVGGTTGDVLGPLGYTTNISFDTIGDAGPVNIFTRLNLGNTWAHYNYDGSVFNSGTFSPCSAGAVAPADAVPSTAPEGFEYEY